MSWFARLFHRQRMEQQLDRELVFHLERHETDLMARGYSREEARRQARIAFGGPEQVKEDCRDARGTRWLDDLVQDVRYALRTLRQNPGFAAVALLTLALGTSATTTMFSVLSGVLLKPLPWADPGRLVQLQELTDWSTQMGNLWAFSYPNFLDCKNAAHSLDLIATAYDGGTVSGAGEPEYADGQKITANLFSVLGVSIVHGRAFLPSEDRPGAAPVAIIGDTLWRRRFGGSDSAIGSRLLYAGKSWTVVGVAPAGFRMFGSETDVFTPLGQDTSKAMRQRDRHLLGVWARLRPGATLEKARAELAVIGRDLARQYPASNRGRSFIADPLRPDVSDVSSMLWLLLGAVSLVLLIACVNVASLMLARAVSRDRELAMRVALGAGRARVMRQCLTESAVLGLLGGALGVALAALGIRRFVAVWPGGLPRAEEVGLDWRVLLFAFSVALGSGLLFGVAPALRVPSRDLEQMLRAGARSIAGRSRRAHAAFVIAEIALAVVLLVCAGMLGRTMIRLSSVDPGMDIHNTVTARMALSPATLESPAAIRAAWDDILARARQVPGVEAIAMVDTVPMREGSNPIGYWTTPAEPPQDRQQITLADSVSPDYLKVTRIPLRRGRFFTDQDRMGSQSVAVIDEVMARQAFGNGDPIGKRIWIGLDNDPFTVIGVVGHVRYWGLASDDQSKLRAQLYYPFAQVPDRLLRRWSELMSIAVRTRVAPLSVIEPLRRAVHGAGSDQVIYQLNTMEHLSSASIARQQFLLLLFGIFAGLALLLACIGIYGVLAYLTGQRVPEIGVRIALGASAGAVLRMVLRESLAMIVGGIAFGSLAALAAARVLARTVEGVQAGQSSTFAVMIPVLMAAALCASFIPARRASRLDPMKALRQE